MFKRMNSSGAGGGGGGRGRRGGAGAKKASGPGGAWKGLIQSAALMCESAAHVSSDESGDDAMQQAEQLKTLLKLKTFQHEQKLDVLQLVVELMEAFLPQITDAADATAKEVDADQLLDAVYSSCLGVLGETLEGAGGDEASESKSEQECEAQAAYALKVLETSINASLQPALTQIELARSKFRPHVSPLVKILQEVSASAARSEFIREASTAVLGQIIELWPKAIEEEKLIEGIIDSCFKLCADNSDESLNPNEFSAQNLGTQTLDALASHIKPTDSVAQLTIARAKAAYESADKFQRKSALVTLAVLPEAGKQYFASNSALFNEIFDLLYRAFKDTAPLVRGAAFIAMSEFLEHGPADNTKSQTDGALAEIFRTLQNPSEPKLTRMKSGIPLMYLAEHIDASKLEEKEEKNNVVKIILQQIKQTRAAPSGSSEDGDLLDSLLNSLRSLFEKQSAAFQPYFAESVETLLPLLNEVEEPWLLARGPAILALAGLAATYGAETFKPHLKVLTQSLVSGQEIVNVPLRTAIHVAWSSLFDVYGDDSELTSHLSAIVTSICNAFQEEYHHTIAHHKKAQEKAKAKASGEAEEEDEEENEEGDEGEEGEEHGEEDEEIDGERKAAIDSFISMTEALGTKFVAHHERIFELLSTNHPEFSEEVKQAIANCCQYLSQVLPPSELSARGKEGAALLKKARLTLFAFIQMGMSTALAQQALQSVEALLKSYKSAFYENNADLLRAIVKTCKRALSQKLLCQVLANHGAGGDDMDDEDEQGEEGDDEEVDMKDFFAGKKNDEEEEEEEQEEEEDEAHQHGKSKFVKKDQSAEKKVTVKQEASTGAAAASASSVAASISASSASPLTASEPALAGGVGSEPLSDGDGKLAHEECPPVESAALDVLVACASAEPTVELFKEAYELMKPTVLDKKYFGYGIGSVGELIDAMADNAAQAVEPIGAELLNNAFRAAEDMNDAYTICSVSFTLGAIFLRAGLKFKAQASQAVPVLLSALQKTKTALQDSKEDERDAWEGAQDNIASAIGKLIIVNSDDFDVKTVLSAFLSALPIRQDAMEVNTAYTATVKLVQKHSPLLGDHLSQLTHIFVEVLSDSAFAVNDKVKQFVSSAAKELLALPDPNGAVKAALAAAGEAKSKKFQEYLAAKQ